MLKLNLLKIQIIKYNIESLFFMKYSPWTIFSPELILICAIILSILLYIINKEINHDIIIFVLLISIFFSVVILIFEINYIKNIEIITLNFFYNINISTQIFKIILNILTFFSLIVIFKYNKIFFKEFPRIIFFYILVGFINFLLNIIISSFDLFLAFLILEALTISISILGIFSLKQYITSEATLKYFIYNAFISSFMILGTTIFFSYVGSTNFFDAKIAFYKLNMNTKNTYIISIMLLLLASSYTFKLVIAPFHFWAIDVYGNFEKTLLLILLVPLKFSVLVFNIKLFKFVFSDFFFIYKNMFLIFALLSITLGAIGALFEDKIKNFFIFTAINQTGFVLLIFFSLNKTISIYAFTNFLLYLIAFWNTFTIIMIFFEGKNKTELIYLSDFKKIIVKPSMLLSLILFILSMAGIPPMAGFLSKYLLIINLFDTGNWFIALYIFIINIISIFYYLRLIKFFYFSKDYIINNNLLSERILSSVVIISTILLFIIFIKFGHLTYFIEQIFI